MSHTSHQLPPPHPLLTSRAYLLRVVLLNLVTAWLSTSLAPIPLTDMVTIRSARVKRRELENGHVCLYPILTSWFVTNMNVSSGGVQLPFILVPVDHTLNFLIIPLRYTAAVHVHVDECIWKHIVCIKILSLLLHKDWRSCHYTDNTCTYWKIRYRISLNWSNQFSCKKICLN